MLYKIQITHKIINREDSWGFTYVCLVLVVVRRGLGNIYILLDIPHLIFNFLKMTFTIKITYKV